MKNVKIYLYLLAGILGVGDVCCYAQSEANDTTHYILTYAENQTEDYPTTQGAKYFADLVEERTNGKIRIMIKAGAQLGTESEVLAQLQYGGIDMARISLSQISELVPEYNVLQLPFLYQDSDHMWRVLESEIGDEFLGMASEIQTIGLSWYDAGVRSFYTTGKPIRTLEDFEGMRIRVQESQIMEDMVNTLGAHAVQVPYGDVYSYLERGLVDGAENNWPSYETMEHYEVAEYFTEDEHTRVPELQLISEHTWNQLTEEDQKIILEAARESSDYERELWKECVKSAKEKAIAGGAQVISISEGEKEKIWVAVSVIYEKYCSDQMDVIEKINLMKNR